MRRLSSPQRPHRTQTKWPPGNPGRFTSRKAEARRFKRWVTHEVLPTLRRTGTYAMHQTDLLEQVVPYLHDQQLRVLHAVQAAAGNLGLVHVARLPMMTGLSIQKVRRTLHLFEALRVIWWETPELVRIRHRYRLSTDRSSGTLAPAPVSLSREAAR